MSDELEHDREVEELVDAADAEARADLRGGTTRPPFGAIVARAHRIDPSAVAVETVGAAASGRAKTRLPEDPVADPTIDAWVAAARGEAEDDARLHASRPRPPMRARVSSAPRRWAMVGAGVLLAAVAVLVIGLRPQWTTEVDHEAKSQAMSAHERDGEEPLTASERVDEERPRARVQRDAEQVRSDAEQVRSDAEQAIDAAAQEAARAEAAAQASARAEAEAAARAEEAARAEAAARASKLERSARSSTRGTGVRASTGRDRAPTEGADRLAALDQEAQRLLAAGRLDAAERALSELVKLGGSHRLVEAAFGDRFTIAHRQGAQGRQQRLWREYLRRFPGGRFADDARAGLCRVAGGEDARQCWSAYVRDFPSGTYRDRADRALARSDAG